MEVTRTVQGSSPCSDDSFTNLILIFYNFRSDGSDSLATVVKDASHWTDLRILILVVSYFIKTITVIIRQYECPVFEWFGSTDVKMPFKIWTCNMSGIQMYIQVSSIRMVTVFTRFFNFIILLYL